MKYLIKGGAFAALHIDLQADEWVKAEKNAMVAMSGDMKLSSRMDGGILRSFARKFSGESFFFQEIRAADKPGWVVLSPITLGGVTPIELDGRTGITAEKSSFLAATEHVSISSSVQRLLKGLFGGEGFVVIKISGQGTVFLSSFGAIEMITLQPGQEIVVDNTHLVAWEDSVTYTLGKGGTSWMSAVLAGEGLIARMKGPDKTSGKKEGRVWIQTRTPQGFKHWMGVLRGAVNSGNS